MLAEYMLIGASMESVASQTDNGQVRTNGRGFRDVSCNLQGKKIIIPGTVVYCDPVIPACKNPELQAGEGVPPHLAQCAQLSNSNFLASTDTWKTVLSSGD
eukprot:3246445-Amphidinium_carterae.1